MCVRVCVCALSIRHFVELQIKPHLVWSRPELLLGGLQMTQICTIQTDRTRFLPNIATYLACSWRFKDKYYMHIRVSRIDLASSCQTAKDIAELTYRRRDKRKCKCCVDTRCRNWLESPVQAWVGAFRVLARFWTLPLSLSLSRYAISWTQVSILEILPPNTFNATTRRRRTSKNCLCISDEVDRHREWDWDLKILETWVYDRYNERAAGCVGISILASI